METKPLLDEPKTIRVLMVGPALDVRGGVSSLESLIFKFAPCNVELRHVATMRDVGKAAKAWVFVSAVARFIIALPKADIIHFQFSIGASVWRKSILTAIARPFGKPCVLHAHGAEFHEFFPRLPSLLQRWIVRWLKGSQRLIVLSESWKRYYLLTFALPEERLEILPNAIELPVQVPHRVSKPTKNLLYLGRYEHRKGPLRLLNALRLLPEEVLKQTHLVMAGDGDVESVRREVSAHGLEQRVTVLDWVNAEQRNSLLAGADVFVLPSLNEGLPMSILEAMSWGIPVVTSPVGGIPEVVQDGFNGFLVPPEDIPALANALRRLIEDEPLRLQMGANARVSVEHLDIRRYWEKLEGIYRAVLSEGKP
jgi:glycosyltransferase involved in cell wall biosynthesis